MIHAFRALDAYFLMDVESGAVHQLDEGAFMAAKALEEGRDPFDCGVEQAQVIEIMEDFQELRRKGALDAPEATPPEISGGSAVKSLCLHVAHDCNLRCKYCFADTGEFHGKRSIMSPDTAKAAMDFLIAHSGGRKHLEVDLFGGEPLMNLPVCRQVVAYGRELEKKFDKHINFTMTTNCVALDDEAADFINREMYNVVVSLDGRKAVHDALRPTVNGKGSYDIIVKKAQRLIAGRGDKEYYVRGTFTRNNLDFTEDVKHLVELGFDQISIEPAVLPQSDPLSILPRMLPRVREEYERLAAYYLEQRKNGKWFHFFHFNIDLEGGPCLRKRITGCGAGTEYIAVTPEGDIYPCHQFVGQEAWKLGSVLDGSMDREKSAPFFGCNVCTKEKCRACWAKYYCSGGCAANAYLYNGSIMQPHEMSCELMRMRTECAVAVYAREHPAWE